MLTVLAAAFSLRGLAQTENKEQMVVPLSEPGKPYKLNVELTFGSIRVIGYDGKDVVVDAQLVEGQPKERVTSGGMHRIGGSGGLDISATEKNNVVRIGSDAPPKAMKLTIKVPKNTSSVKLSTVNDGDIVASDINGDIEVTNVNGAIKLTNVAGTVVANTVNGNVVVTFRSIESAPMAFTTLNGNVDVTFPASLKANVKLRSERGDIYTDFDVDADKSEPKASKTAKDGLYRINVEDWVSGRINGGGPQLLMKNMNGSIYIRKAK